MLKNIKILSLGLLIAFNIMNSADSLTKFIQARLTLKRGYDKKSKLSRLLRLIAVDEEVENYYYPFQRERAIINYSLSYDVNEMFGPAKDETLLRAAVVSRATWAVQALIENGADVSLKNRYGETALQWAKGRYFKSEGSVLRSENMIVSLLEKEADKKAKILHWREKALVVSSSVAKVSIE